MKRNYSFFIILCVFFLVMVSFLIAEGQEELRTSFFDQTWLRSVVSIEVAEINSANNTKDYKPIGTGFLIFSRGRHAILITAKHVIIDKSTGVVRNNLGYRLNNKIGSSCIIEEEKLKQSEAGPWFLSDNDLACRFILPDENFDVALLDENIFIETKFIEPGTPILLLGFPLGLRLKEHALPIVRSGIIGRVDGKKIIVDVGAYPGNSGGPIIYVPILRVSGKGLVSPLLNEQRLVGLVIGYIPYVEAAFSSQTERPRVTFEENSGLCEALSVEAIRSLLRREDVVKQDKRLKFEIIDD